eukprot:TRINITY_DN2748_c0_g1_i3.p1 TRINITY_DN2748_c0_g1~~TRINITY_DN2748_c0_g1_i3.p1  ORF type:complete len:153 (-),score=35.45 TRINITY_DN2748_c0_g1_i3:325-783(-)
MRPMFPYCGAGTNTPSVYNTIFEHLQPQNQILDSNNPIWSSTIPRNQPTEEVVASIPIVGEGTSGNIANPRKRSKNGRELLNDAEEKLRRKMKNRESARRSRERKKGHTEQLESGIERLEKENAKLKEILQVLQAQESPPPKKQKRAQSSSL